MPAALTAICSLLVRAAAFQLGRPSLDSSALPAYFAGVDMLWSWNASGQPALDPLTPQEWSSGAYIGNGVLGAMATAAVDFATNATTAIRMDVGRTDVWGCSQRAPVGYLLIAPAAPAATLMHVDMRVDVYTAQLLVNFTLQDDSVTATRISINADGDGVAATPGVLLAVVTFSNASSPGVTFTWSDQTNDGCAPQAINTGSINASSTGWGASLDWSTQVSSAGTFTVARTLYNDASSRQVLLLAVANSQRSAVPNSSLADAIVQVKTAVAATPSALEAASAAWWASFWTNTSFFSFGGPSGGVSGSYRLEQYAHLAGYRYASAARFTMSDLMGPWGPAHASTCIGPWCQYCWDMNQQVMMYLPTPSNRGLLLAQPAFAMADVFVQHGPDAWSAAYGSNPPGGVTNTLWWLAQLHRYCLYHGDDIRVVQTLLPGLRSSLASSGLQNGTDGLLHVVGCKSPEYPMSAGTDCSYDLSILRWAANTAIAAAAAFDPSDPSLPLYRDIAARLAPYPVDPNTGSFMVAAGVPFAVPHRHYSHLLMIYDLGGLALDVPADTVARSLDVWWSITCAGPQAHGPDWQGDDECRGFTQAAMSAMSTGLYRAPAALGNLTSLLALVGLPNAMYGEEVYAGNPNQFSPVSESAYSAAASVYGMLLGSVAAGPQSGSASAAGYVALTVWPAAPSANASIFRLRSAGALLVSSVRTSGSTPWVAVEADVFADGSGAGLPVQAFTLSVVDWQGVAAVDVLTDLPNVTATPVEGQAGVFAVAGLVRGSAAAFTPHGVPPPDGFVVGVAPGRNSSEANAWGGRFVFQGELA